MKQYTDIIIDSNGIEQTDYHPGPWEAVSRYKAVRAVQESIRGGSYHDLTGCIVSVRELDHDGQVVWRVNLDSAGHILHD